MARLIDLRSSAYGDLAGDCVRDCPSQDCSCTDGSTVLGVDASHLFVLRRAAQVLTSPGTVRDRLLSLIASHRCSGSRHLVSSEVCLREEVTGPREDATKSQPQLAEVLDPADLAVHVTTHSDVGWDSLPDLVPPNAGLIFGERDRRLAVATDTAGNACDCNPLLVTDDTDLVVNLRTAEVAEHINVYPITSGELLLALHECGAITDDELEAVLVAEEARLASDTSMQEHKRALKEDALNRMAVRLGRRTG